MSGAHTRPQVACIDDYDSDVGVRPGTTVEARSAASMQLRREPRRTEQQTQVIRGRERSSTALPQPPPPPVRQSSQLGRRSSTPVGVQEASRLRAGVYRSESQSRRVQIHPPQGHSRSNSINRPRLEICANPNCNDPACMSAQMSRPRSTVPQHPTAYPQPPPALRPAVQAMPAYTPSQPAFGYGPQPRPRTNSFTQPRPTSWAGVTPLPYLSQPQQHGPPPSPSAYLNTSTNVYRQQPTYHPSSVSNTYLQPAYSQPPTPINQMAALSISRPTSALYSTRQLASQTVLPDPIASTSVPPPLVRSSSLSARRPSMSRSIMPGSFPGQSAVDDLYYSDEYDSAPEHEHYRPKRDSKIIATSSRPTMRTTQTTPVFSTRTVQEPPQRAPYSDTGVDFLLYESADSDRTPRPSDSRRYSSTHSSSRSRRPSVSTASSSGRTKATTISSGSGSARQLIEDRDGRRREYRPRAESYADQKIAEAMAYQRRMQGPQPDELTAENMRHMDERRTPATRSQKSGHSRKSGQSGSRSEGVRFTIGDSTFSASGNTHIEIRAADEIRGEHLIVTPGGKDHAPSRTESKSSGSRVGRSRGGSDRGSVSKQQPIAEVREI